MGRCQVSRLFKIHSELGENAMGNGTVTVSFQYPRFVNRLSALPFLSRFKSHPKGTPLCRQPPRLERRVAFRQSAAGPPRDT